jgi:hypothetical protein
LPRKIFFFARTGKVLLKRIGGKAVREVEREEVAYLKRIVKEPQGDVILVRQGQRQDPDSGFAGFATFCQAMLDAAAVHDEVSLGNIYPGSGG